MTQQATLCLDSGGTRVSRAQVEAVPVPAQTSSWAPVPYGDAIGYLHEQADRHLGLEIASEAYGLNKAGDQMFAVLTLATDREDNALAIGLRQSYNKSLALGCAVGSSVFVCDNLCFAGSAFKIVRKNTINVWGDFRALLQTQIKGSLGHYDQVNHECDTMKEIPVDLRRGYALLGVAQGEKVLSPTQASVAYQDWREPRHEEFSERNLWSLYNATTEGLKKGPPARTLDRHARAHDYFTQFLGGSV
jgi:hypothetical protein